MRTPDTGAKSPLSLFKNPEFVALASARFVGGFTFATVILALALYADLFNASGLVAGLFGSAYALFRLILVLPIGRYIDLGNAKRYLLAGLVINAATLVGFTSVDSALHVTYPLSY